MKRIVIVYQPGKVASTSLVSALNSIADVEPHQCHFLGEEAYTAKIRLFPQGNQGDYFLEHGLGQLAQNIKVESALLNHERNGGDSYIFSASREPIDWFRSALTQDLHGTIGTITELASFLGQEGKPIACLASLLLEEIKRILEENPPTQESDIELAPLEPEYAQYAGFVQQQLAVFFRSLLWFDEHYSVFTGKRITLNDDMIFLASSGKRHYMAMRYEDFDCLGDYFNKSHIKDMMKKHRTCKPILEFVK